MSIGSSHSSNTGKSIENLLTIANLFKFKKSDLTKSKESVLALSKK